MTNLIIKDTASNDADLNKLIELLDTYLFELYPPEEVFVVDLEAPSVEDVQFAVAYLEEKPVGCGAIKPLGDSTVELKRFFVLESYRNQGIAGSILRYLEEKARCSNYVSLKLETGDQQFEAIGFYKKNGYQQIPPFGEYVDCPSSVCFEKRL